MREVIPHFFRANRVCSHREPTLPGVVNWRDLLDSTKPFAFFKHEGVIARGLVEIHLH